MLASGAGAAMLGAAAGACANAGIAIAVAKKAAERIDRVRFILVDLLDLGRPLMGRNVTIKRIAIPVPSGDGKNFLQDCGNFILLKRCDDAIGLPSIRFASARFPFRRSPRLPYACPRRSSLNSR